MSAQIGTSELIDLLIAFVVLTVSFGIAFSGISILGGMSAQSFSTDVFVVAGIGVGTGFLLHELAHKFTAIRYGYQAAFRADMNGLFMTILSSLFGVVFAMPGAVMISGREHSPNTYESQPHGSMDDDEYWDRLTNSKVSASDLHISIAGVVTNLILAALFLTILAGHFVSWSIDPYASPLYAFHGDLGAQIAYMGLRINVVLAAFNMIPFGPLDGAKVLRASPIAWAVVGLPMIFCWLIIMFKPDLLLNMLSSL